MAPKLISKNSKYKNEKDLIKYQKIKLLLNIKNLLRIFIMLVKTLLMRQGHYIIIIRKKIKASTALLRNKI